MEASACAAHRAQGALAAVTNEKAVQKAYKDLGAQPIQELRDLTRTRKQLTRETVQHTQRIQAVLEEANLKLSSAISDILGLSGRPHPKCDHRW